MVRLPLKTQPGNARVAAYLAGILILAVVFVPLLTIDLPPLVDYPNHLARQYILAELPRSETLRNFYQADWHATPYLAMDGIVQTLAHAMSVGSAAKVFVALMLFLLAFAPFALNLALFGRITPAALIGLLFVHNTTVSLGFVPYIFSLGFGLCLLALWIRYREGPVWVRLGLFPVLATSLFFCHLIGFAIYGLTVAAYELGRHLDPSSPGKRRAWHHLDRAERINLGSLLLQCGIPLIVFLLFGPASETGRAISQTTYGGIGRKFELLFEMVPYLMPPYIWSIDRAVAIALPVGVIALLVAKKLEYSRPMLWPLGAVVAVFFAMPMQWLGGWGGDHRLLVAVGLLVAGGLRPTSPVLVLARSAAITVEWRAADREAAEFRRSFATIAKGSKVYFAFGHEGGRQSWLRPKYFLPSLAVADRHVFVPYLFTSDNIPGIPLRYHPDFAPLQALSQGPILTNRASPDWAAILDDYDYFIIGNGQYFDSPVPSRLVPVYSGEGFEIYHR
jgi:hypothetical protein